MKKTNSLLLLWLTFLLVVSAVPEQTGASNPMALRESGLDQAARGGSAGGIVSISSTGNAANMLQFKAGGHVLGFQPNKVFLVSLDHALSVEFLGTQGVMPTSVASGPATGHMGKEPALITVVYRNLWDGIDLTYTSTQDGIAESTYHVAPGADVSKIQVRYNVPVEPQGDGSLRYKFEGGYLTESPPVAWQEVERKRVPVRAEFRVAGNEVGFAVGPYDRSQPLIIDPTYKWHAFYGSLWTHDYGTGIALDGRGNIYVLGVSYRHLPNDYVPTHIEYSLFVVKLDSSGTFQWQDSHGGVVGRGIAVDGSGNIYVTGNTPISYYETIDLDTDIFVLKLDSTGSPQWWQFYGSSDYLAPYDYGYGIAVDGSGNIYVTGMSGATWGSPLHAHSGGNDMVVLKLDSSGAYQWHTFYGPGYGFDVAVDGTGNAYVTGESDVTWGSPLHAHSGSPSGTSGYNDIVVLKLDSGGAYQWHTFYGSNYHDSGDAIAVDGNGNVYVTGGSDVTWGSPLHAHSGDGYDNFVLKLDSSGAYQWHTFYGSAGDIALDDTANIYVTAGPDVGVLKLDSNGAYQWQASYGSGSSTGIAVDGSGNIYVTGSSNSNWGFPLNAYSGDGDLLVLKMAQSAFDSPDIPDINGDGRADIIWRHATSGTVYAWLMNGTSIVGQGILDEVSDLNWQIMN
jgi:hypothetical protein